MGTRVRHSVVDGHGEPGEAFNREPGTCSALPWFPVGYLPRDTVGYVRHALDCSARGITYSEWGW
jgi:hypothetical protein